MPKKYSLLLLLLGARALLWAQEEVRHLPGSDRAFSIEVDLAATPIKNQGSSGTCWSFSTLSFLESELLRQGQGEHDLSEMYIVREIYQDKAQHYVRMHGHARFSPGGTFHDVNNVLRDHGLVPQAAYRGKIVNPGRHDHDELDRVLEAVVQAVVPSRGGLTDRWPLAIEGVLDAYLGPMPETFAYQGQTYTPRSFADMLGLDAEDYIELASFTHAPYYEPFVLEVPDNWDAHRVYNLPLDELMQVMEQALRQGYTVAWDGDVSEEGFRHRRGLATVPVVDRPTSQEKKAAAEALLSAVSRQEAFDQLQTTDDHLMHLTGLARDQHGQLFFLTKNSWGESNSCGGYLYMSDSYARLKTVHIMVHKDAVPTAIMEKLKAH